MTKCRSRVVCVMSVCQRERECACVVMELLNLWKRLKTSFKEENYVQRYGGTGI